MSGTTKGGYLPNFQVFRIGGIPFLVKVKPAKRGAEFERTYKHCEMGESGECASCGNSWAGTDAGLGKLCISNDTSFVAIHKWNKRGNFGLGTIWESNQGEFQKKYDNNKKALLASPEAEGTVTLRPYTRHKRKHGKSGPSGVHTGGGGGRTETKSTRGALRRARRSGLGLV